MMLNGRNNKEAKLIRKMIKSGNGHIFNFWNEITDEEKDLLFDDIKKVDLKKSEKYYKKFIGYRKVPDDYFPPDTFKLENRRNTEYLDEAGAAAMRKGKVAYLTVAGGQATRLNYDHPKGLFPISPVKQKPLFRIFAEKIKFISELYSADIKWYIMTSESNYLETIHFFIDNGYFGLKKDGIVFFQQDMLPTLTLDGKLILSQKNRLYMNPDGHGGTLKAMLNIGFLDEMKAAGIKYLYYFQVDNPIINLNDTLLLGYHAHKKSMVTTKVIRKNEPLEKLGCIVRLKNKRNAVIEYSDLPDELSFEKDSNNNMKFEMGSIGSHIFNVDFLLKFTKKLPIHFAKKKIDAYEPSNDGNGNLNASMEFTRIESVKFETFVFDVIKFAEKSAFFECERHEEFSPLKNKTGNDSIESCTNDQIRQHLSWLIDAGLIRDTGNVNKNIKVEISPLYAPDRNIFLQKALKDSDNLKKAVFGPDGNLKNEIYID
jgi:UDP-N-acetylglucosamine/UDP-N-acetylgalactosamine diphosphorylase